MDYNLKVGDILYDIKTKDIGILLERSNNHESVLEEDYVVWAWKIYWAYGRVDYYSEGGLVRIIDAQRFLHFKADK